MSNIDVVKQSFLAFANSDRSANEAVIAADFAFTSPLDNRLSRSTYFERCWSNHEAIVNFKFIRLIEAGDEVVVTYEARSTSGKVFRNTEILTVHDAKITNVEVYFGWNVPHDAAEGGFLKS